MKVKFWGVRGSIPTPEHRNDRYGGNTPCVEVRLNNGTLLVFDCGTGFRALGNSLMRAFGRQPIHAHIFLTHFHWDHIQGIPFFAPFYGENNIFALHAFERDDEKFRGVIEGQLASPYFPVDASLMKSARPMFNLDYGSLNVNGALITSAPLNHPQGCAGYRVDADGATFVFATDNEPGSARHDRALRDLALGADLFVYDAQYTPEQLRHEKKGWGHSSWQEGTRISRECGVRQLVLFHHDPDHDDAFVDSLVRLAQDEFPDVVGAAEGTEVSLPEHKTAFAHEYSTLRQETRYHIEVPVMVAWQDQHGERMEAEALAHDVSNSGIYFVAPSQIPSDAPVEMDIVLPDEVTHQGPMKIHFSAQPIRKQPLKAPHGQGSKSVGVAALRIDPEPESMSPRSYHWIA
jgi:phosphoribosyl 1,2-cyclic phosphodiesterase